MGGELSKWSRHPPFLIADTPPPGQGTSVSRVALIGRLTKSQPPVMVSKVINEEDWQSHDICHSVRLPDAVVGIPSLLMLCTFCPSFMARRRGFMDQQATGARRIQLRRRDTTIDHTILDNMKSSPPSVGLKKIDRPMPSRPAIAESPFLLTAGKNSLFSTHRNVSGRAVGRSAATEERSSAVEVRDYVALRREVS